MNANTLVNLVMVSIELEISYVRQGGPRMKMVSWVVLNWKDIRLK